MPPFEHQFTIALDKATFDALCAMAKIGRRHYREQAARLVERGVNDWLRQGSAVEAAMLEPEFDPAPVA